MNEYPTEAQLTAIEQEENLHKLLDLVRETWNDHYGSVSEELRPDERKIVDGWDEGGRFLRLATGGWSGNEDIIASAEANVVGWAITWCLSARGGLHILKYPKWSKEANDA